MTEIKKVAFIGGNRYSENGPLVPFLEICRGRNFDCTLITDNEHLNYKIADGRSFRDELNDKKIDFIVVDNPNDFRCVHLLKSADLIFSINCHWILKKELLKFIDGKVFNYHSASLPEQQGAGCHSWRIMQGIKKFHLTFHHLTEKIDEGEIIYEQELTAPSTCKNLKETYAFLESYEVTAFESCLDKIIQTYPNIKIIDAIERSKFYWPRLNTEINGFINWAWSAKEIKQFCDAFDEPFGGASTFLNGERVRFKDVEVDDEDVVFHPFQIGLIYRREQNKIWVATKDSGLVVNQIVCLNELKIRKGLRFITDSETLLNAKKVP